MKRDRFLKTNGVLESLINKEKGPPFLNFGKIITFTMTTMKIKMQKLFLFFVLL